MDFAGIINKITDKMGFIDEVAAFVDEFLKIRYAQLQGLHNFAL